MFSHASLCRRDGLKERGNGDNAGRRLTAATLRTTSSVPAGYPSVPHSVRFLAPASEKQASMFSRKLAIQNCAMTACETEAGKGALGTSPPAVSVTFRGRVLLTRRAVLLEEADWRGAARTEEASRMGDARVDACMVW